MAGQPTQTCTRSWQLSLVIPAYNEADSIGQAIAEADSALSQFSSEYEILIVDDGSSDETAETVLAAARHHPRVHLLRHPENRGYGAALRTGFEAARMDLVAFTDADCQFDLAELAKMLPLSRDHEIVAGYRMKRQEGGRRRFFSWGYSLLVKMLLGTGVRDCDCALKVFRKEALAELLPQTSGFLVNGEMLARARQKRFRVAEVGVHHRARANGQSKVSLWDIPRTLRTLLPFWWSQVMFPGEVGAACRAAPASVQALQGASRPTALAGPARQAGPTQQSLGLLFLVMVMVALLFFTRLSSPLLEPQEARYAEIPRQMLASNQWLTPTMYGEPYYDKPPLLYWLVMGCYSLLGVHDWAARLVPGMAGFLTVLLTYFWGKRTLGPRAGFAAALILSLSARYVYYGRMLTMDPLLCLEVTAALAAGHFAIQGPALHRRWWLLSAMACGLGLLTKGPVALVLVVPPLVLFSWLDPRRARPRLGGWLAYLGASVGLAAPWYLAMMARDPEFAPYFFWKHNVVRFAEAFDHQEPFWYYLPGLLLGMLPWTLLLPGLIQFLGRRSERTAFRRPPALGFFLLSFVWSLLFFSAADCKRALYVLPAMPPLALALGCYLDVTLPREKLRAIGSRLRRYGSRLAFNANVLVLVAGLVGTGLAVQVELCKPATGALAGGAIAAVLALVVWQGPKQRLARSWVFCSCATFALLFIGIHQLLPSYARKFSLRGSVRPHAELVSGPEVPVICYPRSWDSVSFYLQRQDVRAFGSEQRAALIDELSKQRETLIFVKSGPAMKELLEDLPLDREYVPLGRQGKIQVGWVRSRWEARPSLFVDHPSAFSGEPKATVVLTRSPSAPAKQ